MAEDVVTKVKFEMLETSEGWKYDGCACDSKPQLTDGNKLKCKKCQIELETTETKYDEKEC